MIMADTVKASPSVDLTSPHLYCNRELSWLEFNYRVLHEAFDARVPLLERLKFLAIFSSNLDEFFMVRVSTLKEQGDAEDVTLPPDGMTPQEQLSALDQRLRPLVRQQHQHFEQELRPKLTSFGVHLLNYADLNQKQQQYLQTYFEKQIFPVLTPLAVDPGHPFPSMSNLSLNLAVTMRRDRTGENLFARVKVPTNLPRFIALPKELWSKANSPKPIWVGVPLEQVIIHNLSFLFPGLDILEACPFRVTRDADFPVQEDEADDLLLAIQQEISKRYFKGFAVRLELHTSASAFVRETLMQGLEITKQDVYDIDGLLGLNDLFFFLSMPLPDLKDAPWTAVVPPRLKHVVEATRGYDLLETGSSEGEDFFSIIRQGDLLVHHPYESFTESVQLFITQAAIDPHVLAIKMTLYRTSGDSPIVQALISAAEHRKQVAALVELKARFDEESNINWAKKLEDAGVHVVYGLVGLKTHTKIVLVVRQEGDEIRRYVHIGTGNYNPKTAKLYTDLGLMSCREELGADLSNLFNHITGYSEKYSFRKLLVSPIDMRDRLIEMIQREIEHCQQGKLGRLIAKMNSLVDPIIIQALYEASQAGVQIDLIIRGICCLRPGVKEVSETIRVISIIGRYLEHSRIFYFQNDGNEEVYIGSADWMPRNLDRRVEAVTPIEEPILRNRLKEILDLMLADNRQAWELQSDDQYVQRHPGKDEPERSTHEMLMEQALQMASPL
jgi:polyphosphate kinase